MQKRGPTVEGSPYNATLKVHTNVTLLQVETQIQLGTIDKTRRMAFMVLLFTPRIDHRSSFPALLSAQTNRCLSFEQKQRFINTKKLKSFCCHIIPFRLAILRSHYLCSSLRASPSTPKKIIAILRTTRSRHSNHSQSQSHRSPPLSVPFPPCVLFMSFHRVLFPPPLHCVQHQITALLLPPPPSSKTASSLSHHLLSNRKDVAWLRHGTG